MNSLLWVPFIFYIFHKVPQKVLDKSFYQKLELTPFAARKFKVKQLITMLENLSSGVITGTADVVGVARQVTCWSKCYCLPMWNVNRVFISKPHSKEATWVCNSNTHCLYDTKYPSYIQFKLVSEKVVPLGSWQSEWKSLLEKAFSVKGSKAPPKNILRSM